MVKDKDTTSGATSRSKVVKGVKQVDENSEADTSLPVSPVAQPKTQKTGTH